MASAENPIEKLENSFKPETRKSGEDIFRKQAVFLSSTSDTGIQAFVKVSGNQRVKFSSSSIADPAFSAECGCSTAAKNQLCKHMWAVVLAVEEKYPDFLESKETVEVGVGASGAGSVRPSKPALKYTPSPEAAAKAEERAQLLKERNAQYRKLQYQKQKERMKEMKQAKKEQFAAGRGSEGASGGSGRRAGGGSSKTNSFKRSYPEHVQESLKFFAENGFAMEDNLNEEDLSTARKKLSRIFHPDKGGSHDEALILNEHYSVLEDYLHEQG